MASLATALPGFSQMSQEKSDRPLIKPSPLRPGATVALIAPSSPVTEEKISKALDNLHRLGYKVLEGKHLRAQYGHLAGSDEDRLADLHEAFQNPEVEAVWCIRGGYGATRYLPMIDFELIRRHPKPLIGYSDVTALHLAIHQKTGLVTFHGTVAAGDFPDDTLQYLYSVLVEPETPLCLSAPQEGIDALPIEFQPFTLSPGKGIGALTGGNLSLLSAMAGTAYAPEFAGKIVFMEEVGEQPYRIDRMLTQLLQSTDLAHAAGIVLGNFFDCQPKPGSFSLSLQDTLKDRLGGLGIPAFYGLPFGHVPHQVMFPYGIQVELDTDRMTLTFVERAVR